MSNIPVPGAQYDLYSEQLFNNMAATYTGTTYSDDYRFNITPASPARPNLTPSAPYATQPILSAWHGRNKGDVNTAAWTASFPVIPGT